MEKRREINDRLVKWIHDRAESEFARDISLIVAYGSHVNGTANSMSDVDCYFVPKTQRGYDFARCFILGGVGYDVFPVSWERLEGFADLKESLIPLLGEGKIIYCADDDDLKRFERLKDRLRRNLADDEAVRKAAVSRCEFAAGLMARLERSEKAWEIRMIAGYIAMFLAEAAAFMNKDYFHYGLKRQFEDLSTRFPAIPDEIIDGYRAVAEAVGADTARDCARRLFFDVCRYVGCSCEIPECDENGADAPGEVNAEWLAGLYEEIVSTFNKIYVCCKNGDHILAFISAVCLQYELCEAREAGYMGCDLIGDFDFRNLAALEARTREAERDFVGFIEKNGGKIKRYADFDEFERLIR